MTTTAPRPWPVVLLTALGAWLAAIPVLIAVGMLLGDTLTRGVGAYAVGVMVLGASVVVLRAKDLPLFVEQLAIPALLVGGGTLTMGVASDFGQVGGSLLLLGVVVALAAASPQAWLRVLLGALAAGLLGVALVPESGWGRGMVRILWVLHGLLAVWLLATYAARSGAARQTLIAPLSTGWLLATTAALAWTSGTSFLIAGAVGSNEVGQIAGALSGHAERSLFDISLQWLSAALVLVAAALGAQAWPALRTFLAWAVALVLAVLAWFMPALGATLLAVTVVTLSHHWRLAAACVLAAAWILGAFYYQLQWPLTDKALLLVAAGTVLAMLVWVHHIRLKRRAPAQDSVSVLATQSSAPAIPSHRARNVPVWAILGGVILTLLLANGAIWQKENLIANGTKVFVPLAPVDPRSLMQGDYMRLNFAAINDTTLPLLGDLGGQRPHMVVKRDARGVASVVRLHMAGEALTTDEMLLELTPKDGRWVVVTDAWFFKEGEAALWQTAKFGEFRVLPDGRALLVSMADANLKAIESRANK